MSRAAVRGLMQGRLELVASRHAISVRKHTIVANQGWRRRFTTIEMKPSEITCLSHNADYDWVFHTLGR
jgi:hypothetical protein